MPALYAGYLVDRKLKIPLPLAPRLNLPERQESVPNIERLADDHHPAEGEAKLIKGSIADRALRYSRCQWVLYGDHHEGYHRNGLKPVLPAGLLGRFRYVSFMAALYLPDKCVGFHKTAHGPKPDIRELSNRDRALMWERGDVRVEKSVSVGRFLASAVVRLGLPELGTDFDVRLQRGFVNDPDGYTVQLMNRLTELAARSTGLKQDYEGARDEGLLPPDAPRTAKDLLVGCIQGFSRAYGGSPPDSIEPVTAMLQRAMGAEVETETEMSLAAS
ncbi:MAG TPA: hypothetical protein VF261_00625 [Candidatus Saccharimonadales bacterium]